MPDAPFTPGATYTSRLDWSCDPVESTFTVSSDTWTPVDGASLVGRSWIMDMRLGRFASPINIGEVFQTMLEVKLLLGVTASDADGLSLIAGAADPADAQDLCSPTTDFDVKAAFDANPYFTAEQSSLVIEILGDLIGATDLQLSGAWTADATAIEGVSLRTTLDTRDLIEAVGVGDEPDSVCNLFRATYGVQCGACPSGEGDYCIDLVVDSLTMPETGYAVVARSQAEIDADPSCIETTTSR